MIFVGEKPKNKPRISKLKGKIINGYIVLEDMFYTNESKRTRHRCICKCLFCGKLHRMTAYKLRKNEKPCRCHMQMNVVNRYRKMRKKLAKTVSGEINRLKAEALFEDDYKRIANLKEVLGFIESQSLDNYFTDVDSLIKARKMWNF